jgi:hypothetical protein
VAAPVATCGPNVIRLEQSSSSSGASVQQSARLECAGGVDETGTIAERRPRVERTDPHDGCLCLMSAKHGRVASVHRVLNVVSRTISPNNTHMCTQHRIIDRYKPIELTWAERGRLGGPGDQERREKAVAVRRVSHKDKPESLCLDLPRLFHKKKRNKNHPRQLLTKISPSPLIFPSPAKKDEQRRSLPPFPAKSPLNPIKPRTKSHHPSPDLPFPPAVVLAESA